MAIRPERRFGPGAVRLAGLTARMFGWLPEQFWHATPAELAAVLSPYRDESEQSLARDDLNRMMERENA